MSDKRDKNFKQASELLFDAIQEAYGIANTGDLFSYHLSSYKLDEGVARNLSAWYENHPNHPKNKTKDE
jgi:hypothetical protein